MSLTQNYFELFRLAPGYQLDLDVLAQRQRELQQQAHPDRFASASDLERRAAMQLATLINDGYRTLRDPLLRAEYLLSLSGIGPLGSKTVQDPEFLMAQMELREQLEEIRASRDVTQLQALQQQIGRQLAAMQQQLALLFDDASAAALGHAQQTVIKYSFFRRLLDEAETLEDDLLI